MEDKIKLHAERAMEELDRAAKAGSSRAAKAHFALSSLHMEKMRSLGTGSVAFQFQ